MQANQQTQEKGLFTFYQQQQHFQSLQPIPENTQVPSIATKFTNKKKAKKKNKHQNELIQKSSHEDASKPEFQPFKEQAQKKPKPRKKGHKLSRKKIAKQQLINNSTLPQNNSSTQNQKQHFLSIISSYNTNKKTISSRQFQNSVSMVLKPHQKTKVLDLNRGNSPTLKKTIISQANMTIHPFQKQPIFQEDDYLFNDFGSSLNSYTKNPEKKSEINRPNQSQLVQKVQSALDKIQNHDMKEKFLSKVIRKNKVYDPQSSLVDQKRISFGKTRCITELSQKKDTFAGLFQNKQITQSIAQKQKSQRTVTKNSANQQKPEIQNKIDKYLRFESKTQELRKHSRIQKGQLRKFSKVTSVHLPTQKQEDFRCEINSSNFMPLHRSSLAIQEINKTDNSQIFESYDVYQHYRRLKTKSKKVLRFSMIKIHTTKGIENNKVLSESKDLKERVDKQTKEGQPKQIQTFKLPIITNGCKRVQKQQPRVFSSDQKTQQNDKKSQQQKSSTKNKLQSLQKHKTPPQANQAKQRIRCFTQQQQCDTSQIDMIKSKIMTVVDTQIRDSNRSRLKHQPEELYKKKFIEKSISTKIIQNFQQRHYRKPEQQKDGIKLSTLDMSENFIMNWKESLDWESKKKLIVKKLGIKL